MCWSASPVLSHHIKPELPTRSAKPTTTRDMDSEFTDPLYSEPTVKETDGFIMNLQRDLQSIIDPLAAD